MIDDLGKYLFQIDVQNWISFEKKFLKFCQKISRNMQHISINQKWTYNSTKMKNPLCKIRTGDKVVTKIFAIRCQFLDFLTHYGRNRNFHDLAAEERCRCSRFVTNRVIEKWHPKRYQLANNVFGILSKAEEKCCNMAVWILA